MKQISCDVLVIGAGPAGSVAAALLHKAGLNVRVVEKESFPRFVIGESMLPRCMEVLEDCGFLDAVKKKNFQQKFGAKFMKGNEISDFNFSEQFSNGWQWTWQVQRAVFDSALIDSVIERGVPVDFKTAVTAITFNSDGSSRTTTDSEGQLTEIKARYIVDASGYGRVIPRLFNLDEPSTLAPRKAVFAHMEDPNRAKFEEPNRITVVNYAPQTWVWVIPFATGTTSVGFVGTHDFFNAVEGDLTQQFETLISKNEYLNARFGNSNKVFEPRKLEGWSTKTKEFFGNGFVLTGNVTEFLDPIFSSGAMFAMVSSHLATSLLIKKLKGEAVDWKTDYVNVLQPGINTFKAFVMAWYDGTLEKIFYHKNPDLVLKRQICSVLAGYVWDQNNPFVVNPEGALRRLSKIIDFESRMNADAAK